MKLFLKNATLIIIFLAGIGSVMVCKAVEENATNNIGGSKGPIALNVPFEVKDNKFENPNFIWTNATTNSVKNNITFRLVDNILPITQTFNCTITFDVVSWSTPNSSGSIPVRKTLTVGNSTTIGVNNQITDTYSFTDAYKVRVTVISIFSPELGSTLPNYFELSNSISVDRQYNFTSINNNINTKLGITANSFDNNGALIPVNNTGRVINRQLEINWIPVLGAEEYDLEWTTLDSVSDFKSIVDNMLQLVGIPNETLTTIFKNNATRITTSLPSYKLSLPYDNKYLLVRIRQVQYRNGLRIEDDWDYKINNQSNYALWILNWHQDKLNWQYSAAYAEEGKKKEVVNYFDGSMRNRQTVTLNNTDKVAIVQENIYDKFGRQTASILPAPFKEQVVNTPAYLHYVPNFNRDGTNTAYNAADIVLNCEITPSLLNTSFGASKYYSPSSDYLDDINGYIPDAEQFPISVTQYTADNTGRIKIQGGVGPTFQPGLGKKRTTKYFYGKPEQWELDQLFGNDVGYAEHYQKNTVVDANEQVSVSYLNASGKTIATALTGTNPENLSALSNITTPSLKTTNLLKAEQFIFDNTALKISATTTYTSTVVGTATFDYEIQKLVNRYQGITPANKICSSCYYNLTITVKNDCGEPFTVVNGLTKPNITAEIGSKIITSSNQSAMCIADGIFPGTFTTSSLPIGSYNITFELAISQTVMENYLDNYLAANTDLKKEGNYIFDYLQNINFSDCLSDCRSAAQTLGDTSTFKAMFAGKLNRMGVSTESLGTAYPGWIIQKHTTLLSQINAAACDYSPCNFARQQMLQDVTVGGQYAPFDKNGNALETNINVISNNFSKEFPLTGIPKDDDIITLPDSTSTISPYDASFTLTQLITYWKPQWAENFLKYHPEFCKLEFCESKTPTFNIYACKNQDESIKEKTSNAAYNTLTSEDWLLKNDLFFNGPGIGFKPAMLGDLTNYSDNVLKQISIYTPNKSLLAFVKFQLYCSDKDISGPNTINTTLVTPIATPITPSMSVWVNCTPNPACIVPDREWELYKGYYYDLKEKYYKLLRDGGKCANKCATVGTPLSIPILGACPVVSDFTISTVGIPAAGKQKIRLGYKNGSLTKNVKVWLLYPSGFNAAALPTSVKLSSSNPTDSLSIPDSVPVSSIKVLDVECENTDICFNYSSGVDASNSSNIAVYNKSGTRIYSSLPTIVGSGSNLTITRSTVTPFSSSQVWGGGNTNANLALPNIPPPITDYTCSQSNRPLPLLNPLWPLNRCGIWSSSNMMSNIDEMMGFEQIIQIPVSNTYYIGYAGDDVIGIFLDDVLIDFDTNLEFWSIIPVIITAGPHKLRVQFYNKGYSAVAGIEIYNNTPDQLRTATNYAQLNVIFTTANLRNNNNVQSFRTVNGVQKWHFSNPNYIYNAINIPTPSLAPNCTNNAFLTKKSRFDDISQDNPYLTSGGSTTAALQAHKAEQKIELDKQIKSSCENNANNWMRYLKPGLVNYSETTKNNLKNTLIAICKGGEAGGDKDHPQGASSLPSGVTVSGYKNFGEAILGVLGIPKFTELLNPYLFDGPAPYDRPQQKSVQYINNSSAAICTKLATLPSLNSTEAAQMDYFKITQQDLATLKKSCSNCKYLLDREIKLPPKLEPNSPTCINLATYNVDKTILNSLFSSLTTTSPNYKIILANYFNQKYGYALGYTDYKNFELASATDLLCNEPPYGENTSFDQFDCVKTQMGIAVANGKRDYATYIEQEKNKFRLSYTNTCASAKANVNLIAKQSIYHYTLYYYDQAGNLVRTVPPEGVQLLTPTAAQQIQLNDARKNSTPGIYPAHTLSTTYAYNATNQVVQQQSPDGGNSRYWYDLLSRLVLSQNQEQKEKISYTSGKYSYTKYDLLGRINEVGERLSNINWSNYYYLSDNDLSAFYLAPGTNSQITRTVYDSVAVSTSANGIPTNLYTGLLQNNLRKRVSANLFYESSTSPISGMFYNYDLSGNVKNLYRQIPGLGYKKIGYEYDLISGKVNFVAYQYKTGTANADQFFYQYKYDAENRLTEAWSSPLATVQTTGIGSYLDFDSKRLDASYQYYLHGPLARVELGDQLKKVQGLDYVYTLQGWLKSVNGNHIDPFNHITSELSKRIGIDVLAYALNYYTDDYKPIGGTFAKALKMKYDPILTGSGKSLFNGNISSTTMAINGINGGLPVGYVHDYDQLNRLVNTKQNNLTNTTTNWSGYTGQTPNYQEALTYDANGNINTLVRYGNTGVSDLPTMDNLTYNYPKVNGKKISNKLNFVKDEVANIAYPDDIDNQAPIGALFYDALGNLLDTAKNNYKYDAIGNLTRDLQANIKDIYWTVYGKIKRIAMQDATKSLTYNYDPAGNRQIKTINGANTYYVRDPQGNILATYEETNGYTTWKEQHLYGSNRLGIWKPEISLYLASGTTLSTNVWKKAGLKQYELTNHLGNVMATISDKRTLTSNGQYLPDVLTAQDYYPGGMSQPGRSFTQNATKSYRFGFNGKENDNDVKGKGNQQDYGMRIYDTRLSRFLSVDPIANSYPMLTPYQFASNTPIQAIDLDGLEAFVIHGTQQAESGIKLSNATLVQLSRISGHPLSAFDQNFRWKEANKGRILNTQQDRKAAARRLVDYIVKTRSEMIANHQITKEESLTLIGYSHGGNVSTQAINMLGKKGIKANLITLSTPAYNRGSADSPRGDIENPNGNNGIFQHIQIVHENDNVVDILAGGNETYTNPSTRNYVIKDSEIPISGGIDAHTEVYKQKGYSNFLKSVDKMIKAPAPKE